MSYALIVISGIEHKDVVNITREQYDALRAALVSQVLDQQRRVDEYERRLREERELMVSTDQLLDLLPEVG